ncbi:MAG: hypothetical protein HN390_11690 [Anaerolineae bacterium]|jgi:hypothetical protein|nr:hypothetical protein [Anaerolineae bacterium]
MSEKITPHKLAQSLFSLNALIWAILAILTLLRLNQTSPQQKTIMLIIGIMMLGNAGTMLLSGWLLSKKRKPFYFFALAVLLVNILLTFTDQFGLPDLLTLLLDLILLTILLIKRKSFY